MAKMTSETLTFDIIVRFRVTLWEAIKLRIAGRAAADFIAGRVKALQDEDIMDEDTT